MNLKIPRHIVVAVLFLTVISCGSEKQKPEIPAGILNPEQMRLVLADFALAESAAALNVKSIPMHKIDSAYAFDPLIENNIRKTQFDSSLQFYSERPELYKEIYDSVLVTLSQMKTLKSASVSPQTSK